MEELHQFRDFGKIARLSRECVITEKIDGTNAQVVVYDQLKIDDDGKIGPPPNADYWLYLDEGIWIAAGSRNRYITPDNDNFGFARWVWDHADELVSLGHGRHFGEWWGQDIQRGYGLTEKRFSLFNTSRWNDPAVRPKCCHVVPQLITCEFNTDVVNQALLILEISGSAAAPGFMDPEGVVVYHTASNQLFKKTIKNDDVPKTQQRNKDENSSTPTFADAGGKYL